MAEVLEYALVVLVSSMVAAFSVQVYGGYEAVVGDSTDRADFAAVVALAHSAIETGSAAANLTFGHAIIGCSARNLSFTTSGLSENFSVPVECDFVPTTLSGQEDLTFRYSSGLLTLKVR